MATNVTNESKSCSLCGMVKRDNLSCNGKHKDMIKRVMLSLFPAEFGQIGLICKECWRRTFEFYNFKTSVENKLTLKRGCDLTPDRVIKRSRPVDQTVDATTPSRRVPVLRSLLNSLTPSGTGEILVVQSHTPTRRIPVVQSLLDSLEKLKLSQPVEETESTNLPVRVKPKRQLTFGLEDHSYTERKIEKEPSSSARSTSSGSKEEILLEVQAALSRLSDHSVLSQKSPSILSEEDMFSKALHELETHVPFLSSFLQAVVGSSGNKTATIVMIYAMIMHSRNKQLSAIQRMMTILAVKCHADNKLLGRLNKVHITLSAQSKKNIVTECSEHCEKRVINKVAAGQDGKLNGDNVDIFVTTNDIRMKNKNKDYHFFATDWTPYRLSDEDFNENEYLKECVSNERNVNVTIDKFQPDVCEYRQNIKVLVARIFINHLKFKWMVLVVPDHIDQPLKDIMSRKTTSFCLPILLKNEAKYEDCIQIMDAYEHQVSGWYRRAGRGDDFPGLAIPVGGDQLTRVRLDGAKNLRIGAHTAEERFDNLYPVIVEMFHTQMDFLEKTFLKFMRKSSGRDVGTLSHLKTTIQRSSVNCNVKSRFKAHMDFVLIIGKAYLLEAAMEHFGLEDVMSDPTKNQPPDDVGKCHLERRTSIYNETMDSFMKTVIGPLNFDEVSEQTSMQLQVGDRIMSVPVKDGKVKLNFQHQGQLKQVNISLKDLNELDSVRVLLSEQTSIDVSAIKSDDLHNYVLNFLQYYFVLLNFKDAIAEGDISRVSNTLKLMVPFFYNHSALSKYMVECIDYVLKTEILLPVKLSLQVRVASFVNPKGKVGKNKASDMQKENQVKEIKDLIKGLGANKTENSIVKLSKAAPVINDIVVNLDGHLNYKDIKSSHKSRSEEEDLQNLLLALREVRPFKKKNGRKLISYKKIKASMFNELLPHKAVFDEKVMKTANRLKRGLSLLLDDTAD